MKISIFSDFDQRGSGYGRIAIPLSEELVKLGHEVKAIGLGYDGSQHDFNFSIIPVSNIQDGLAVANNLVHLWQNRIMIIALDIPIQQQIFKVIQGVPDSVVSIMPLEADPLCFTWAQLLAAMKMPWIISEFGVAEAKKMGVDAHYLEVGVDTKAWRMPKPDEKANLRKAFDLKEDAFVVLTVADNQERKNLSRSIEMFADFQKDKPGAFYILVTREHNYVGWNLRDFFQECKIPSNKFMIVERGISFKELWSLYAMADVFLLTSKAEGLGLPILEAMAVGVPVMGTDCTAIAELLADGRGYPIPTDYDYRDPFGNGRRYFANRKAGVAMLDELYDPSRIGIELRENTVLSARKYVEKRNWGRIAKKFSKALEATFPPLEVENGEAEA